MASVHDCHAAMQLLAERLDAVDPDVRSRYAVSRTVSCYVPDLDVVFTASLGEPTVSDLRWDAGPDPGSAQIRLTAASDDLLALLEGRLAPPSAWATGRLRIEASVRDLLRLRTLL